MGKERVTGSKDSDEKKARARKPKAQARNQVDGSADGSASLVSLQHQAGNRAVQRLLAQRSGGEGAFDLDDETAGRINRERGGGQPLDQATQEHMGQATGYDFSQVRVHTSPEANDLSQQLGAKAFTTGKDIYFKDGAYDPGSSGGQELLAHELTHVVQQGSGAVSGGGQMHVNAPGDAYEQQADALAHSITSSGPTPPVAAGVQRQEEDKEEVQMQEDEKEEVQLQEEDEKEEVQMQADEQDEEEAA